MNVMGNFNGETTNIINLTRSVIIHSKYLTSTSISQIIFFILSLIF